MVRNRGVVRRPKKRQLPCVTCVHETVEPQPKRSAGNLQMTQRSHAATESSATEVRRQVTQIFADFFRKKQLPPRGHCEVPKHARDFWCVDDAS
jgi:hypothetical protein